MKKIVIYLITIPLFFLASCNWLDVPPKEQTDAKELFTSYQGFCDALNGCYMAMKSRAIYGEQLSFADIECMAYNWDMNEELIPQEWAELRRLEYEGTNAQAALGEIYLGLYNTIAQANMVINAMPDNGNVIPSEATRAMIEGEARAIRAFCHFDVLRLFGQLPSGAGTTVSLPYAEQVSPRELPPYYTYEQFVQKVEDDLAEAERLLADSDPLFDYTYEELTDAYLVRDNFLCFRQNRFSYWAVKALQARFYLYTGATDKARAAAMSVIEAKNADGGKLLSLSGTNDLAAGYNACPSEAIMQLNVYNIAEYAQTVLTAPAGQAQYFHLTVTTDMNNEVFPAPYTASNRRSQWVTYSPRVKLTKYWYDINVVKTAAEDITKRQVLPLLRLSEMYLIAVETAASLGEANTLWAEYLSSHGITATPFSSMEEVEEELVKLYRIEFYGEGQMFFLYKRLGAEQMLWRTETVGEEGYVVPLPATEYDLNF